MKMMKIMDDKDIREWTEISANPKFKMNHIKCRRCGTKLYAPMPAECDHKNWGTTSWSFLIIAYLVSRGWKVVAPENYFVCPDCVKKTDVFKEPIGSAIIANRKYLEWVKKMRDKYNFYIE